MPWVPAAAPLAAWGEAEAVVVEDALLTAFNRGHLRIDPRSAGGPSDWIVGAVHDSRGRLVTQSQRVWCDDPMAPAPSDPPWVTEEQPARRLEGSWIYAGHWTGHFGHFLIEVLTNLWPDPAALDLTGVVAHRSFRGGVPKRPGRGPGVAKPALEGWQRELLRLAGYGGLDLRIVRQRPARVDHLVVPSRPVVLKNYAQPSAVAVWRRIAASAGGRRPGSPRRVFLSRSEFHGQWEEGNKHIRSTPAWDRVLDQRFHDAGFAVVAPERLPVTDQIRLIAGADVLAGQAGSALHLSGIAPPGARVLELGDSRSPVTPSRTQLMIDAASDHLTAFVPYLDLQSLDRTLGDLPDDTLTQAPATPGDD